LAKAKVIADIFWKKVNTKFEETRTDFVGSGSIWPSHLNVCEPNEIYLRFSARDHDEKKFDSFSKTLATIILSGPSGMAVTGGGRPKPSPVIAYWPTLIDRERITTTVTTFDTEGKRTEISIAPKTAKSGKSPIKEARLRDIAFARSGDKGDTCNIGVIARNPEAYDWLCKHLTDESVKRFFKGITKGKVVRYELDNLHALNFLLERTLGGGGTRSLMVDPQGKTLSQALLEMRLKVPARLLKQGGKAGKKK
jgi:hypothetical protein